MAVRSRSNAKYFFSSLQKGTSVLAVTTFNEWKKGVVYNSRYISVEKSKLLEYYIHFRDDDIRLDRWCRRCDIKPLEDSESNAVSDGPPKLKRSRRKDRSATPVPSDTGVAVKLISIIQFGSVALFPWYPSILQRNTRLPGQLWVCNRCFSYFIYLKDYRIHLGADGVIEACGYFSKEKSGDNGKALSCLCVFPHEQRNGYGMFLIEFCYELCKRNRLYGTPERPLSDEGRSAFMKYWTYSIFNILDEKDGRKISITSLQEKSGIVAEDILDMLEQYSFVKNCSSDHIILIDRVAFVEAKRCLQQPKIKLHHRLLKTRLPGSPFLGKSANYYSNKT
ncbi:putative MYST-like histone acetyltransferase 1 [Trichinella nativa]|uniref:Histone acetyltransferase n=1 Tax=Trichinella nativa TaxID=6335 RepID=A0A0V1KYP0_9BILA|nr:putative MYST-like histone acetyltransferase 1 [Trichinella nativa]